MRTLCIRVNKAYGEKALLFAKRTALLNLDLKIQREQDYLYIPLIRKPRQKDLYALKTALSSYEVLQRDFQENVKRTTRLDQLKNKLPSNLLSSFPHSIDYVGDIAVINVPPELENYKNIIGHTILKSNKRVNTVLAKTGAVSGEYRIGGFETISGVDKTATIHKEYGCIFHVDLAKAFFSPRLSYEHNRLASLVKQGETVLDMFAGVGPFSILIAKKQHNTQIYATEINPEAFKLLRKNILTNRVNASVKPLLGDARQIAKERFDGSIDRIIMNLPEKSVRYVDAACMALTSHGGILHYYEFNNAPKPLETAEMRLTEVVQQTDRKVKKIFHSKIVRGVAPCTWQVVVDAKIE